jgi:steroid 5-alpha reductase family enzyme
MFGWVVVALIQAGAWIHQEKSKNATLVDIVWVASIMLLAVIFSFQAIFATQTQRVLVMVLPLLWGFRLGAHLYVNRVHGHKAEDSRYAELRQKWGPDASFNFFILYQAQALISAIMATSFLAMLSKESAPSGLLIVGILIWAAGVVGETLADHQLQEFKRTSSDKLKTCRTGLWKYSRHPNYFFEWITWCSYLLMTASWPRALTALIAPMFLLLLIYKVTGIPPSEAQSLKKRGEDYRDYQKTTPAFFPKVFTRTKI